jgi:hypothetical protein
MSKLTIRSLRWLAPVALAGTLGLAACGGDEDAAVSAATAERSREYGSDRHLENMSAEIADRAAERSREYGSDRHLENMSAEIADRAAERPREFGSDRHLEIMSAEIADRAAAG